MSGGRVRPTEFIPEEEQPRRFSTWRVYGVRLKNWESRAIWDRIDEVNGIDRSDRSSVFANSVLRMTVGDRLRDEYGMGSYYLDDVTLRICDDLGIDWRAFPHNTPVLPIAPFIEHAKRNLAGFKLATNETQWTMQSSRIWKLFNQWVDKNCRDPDCEDDGHRHCVDCYEELDLWSTAKRIGAVEEDRQTLLASIDAKPRAKAVKVANDALARIAVADKSHAAKGCSSRRT